MHCLLLHPAKRQPSLNEFRRQMVCAAHSCPGMNCSQPRRIGATVRLLLRVGRSSLPLKDYYLGEIKDYYNSKTTANIDCFLLRGKKKGRTHCFLLRPTKRRPSLNEFQRQMLCAAHSCPGMNCSQPRRKGATVRLLRRVSRISLPLEDYYLQENQRLLLNRMLPASRKKRAGCIASCCG